MAISLSIAGLISFFPSLQLSPRVSPPPSRPWWRPSCNRRNPPSCLRMQASSALPTTTAVSDPFLLPPPAEEVFAAARSCFPCLAWANVLYSKGGHYNVQVVVGEDEPEEALLRRFKREVMKAGVIQECKHRRWFETMHEKKKRKNREATRRNRKRRYQPKAQWQEKQEESNEKKVEETDDNWEIPEGELPYC